MGCDGVVLVRIVVGCAAGGLFRGGFDAVFFHATLQ
jgi:hypothetical protein